MKYLIAGRSNEFGFVHRQISYALACQGEQSVANSGGYRRYAGLSDPTRFLLALNSVHLHFRHLVEAQDLLVVEIVSTSPSVRVIAPWRDYRIVMIGGRIRKEKR